MYTKWAQKSLSMVPKRRQYDMYFFDILTIRVIAIKFVKNFMKNYRIVQNK